MHGKIFDKRRDALGADVLSDDFNPEKDLIVSFKGPLSDDLINVRYISQIKNILMIFVYVIILFETIFPSY